MGRVLVLDIAIAGAGIGGLATAALLAQAGHRVVVFERFAVARPLGSGLVIQPVGLAVLDQIGAGTAARVYGAPVSRMLGHGADGSRVVLDVSYRKAAPGLAMHRAALFEVLWQAVARENVAVVTDACIVAAPLVGDKRLIQLENGATHGPYDLVVDASGAGSRLSPLVARALPYGAVWGTVPWPETALAPDQLRQRYHGARRMAGVLPVGRLPGDARAHAAVFWSLPVARIDAWQTAPLADWKAEAVALWPELAPFLAGVTRHDQMTPARYTHGTLRRPFAPGLAMIGDAAHRASPQLGQGANMALLDAFALVQALRGPMDDALPRYAASRRWHVRAYQAMSFVFTPMYQSDSRVLPVVRDRVLAPLAGVWPVRGVLTRLVSGDMLPPVAGVAFP